MQRKETSPGGLYAHKPCPNGQINGVLRQKSLNRKTFQVKSQANSKKENTNWQQR
jgi:hypothetical protein